MQKIIITGATAPGYWYADRINEKFNAKICDDGTAVIYKTDYPDLFQGYENRFATIKKVDQNNFLEILKMSHSLFGSIEVIEENGGYSCVEDKMSRYYIPKDDVKIFEVTRLIKEVAKPESVDKNVKTQKPSPKVKTKFARIRVFDTLTHIFSFSYSDLAGMEFEARILEDYALIRIGVNEIPIIIYDGDYMVVADKLTADPNEMENHFERKLGNKDVNLCGHKKHLSEQTKDRLKDLSAKVFNTHPLPETSVILDQTVLFVHLDQLYKMLDELAKFIEHKRNYKIDKADFIENKLTDCVNGFCIYIIDLMKPKVLGVSDGFPFK